MRRTGRRVESRTVGEIQRERRSKKRVDTAQRAAKASRVPIIIIAVIVVVVGIVIASIFLVSRTEAFEIQKIDIQGADHLTDQELSVLVSIPKGTTLLSVDEDSIIASLERDAWVESVNVERTFPDTLTIHVTERKLLAIVEVPMGTTQTLQNWAIAEDHMWLMAIPSRESEIGSQLSETIYNEMESVLHITDVPTGVTPVIGEYCSDKDIDNALSIISGLTTELADRIKSISAPDIDSTSLILDNNIEISFGSADNIREKERACLQIMQDNPTVVYINVRVVARPTWKAA